MILNLFNKNNKENKEDDKNMNLVKMTALLIHAAKIDENYSEKEKKIVLDFIKMSSKEERSDKNISQEEALILVKKAEEYENNSNHILEYTREVKKMSLDTKK